MSIEADPATSPDGTGSGAGSRPAAGLFGRVLAIGGALVLADQLTKLWAESTLSRTDPVRVVGDLLQFRLAYNPGAAFSIGSGSTWIFTVITAVAVGAVIRYARRVRSAAWALALGLLLGGASTHLLDRLFREPGFARGHVVDFIDYAGFFVGNVADIAIAAGVTLIIILQLRGVGVDGSRPGR